MNRRGFLTSCLALGAAPAICRAESLMHIITPQSQLILPGNVGYLVPGQYHKIRAQYTAITGAVQYFLDDHAVDAIQDMSFQIDPANGFTLGFNDGQALVAGPKGFLRDDYTLSAHIKRGEPKSAILRHLQLETGPRAMEYVQLPGVAGDYVVPWSIQDWVEKN